MTRPVLTKTCLVCKKEFTTTAPKSKYCCKACSKIAQKARESERELIKSKPISKPAEPHRYKLWDFRDPECQEVYRFIMTEIKPLL